MDRDDTIVLYRSTDGEWRWRRTAPNGEPVGAAHEGYSRRADAEANIERTQGGRYTIRVEG